jgi:CubicO group peptidase (beta-lactamase class C family)
MDAVYIGPDVPFCLHQGCDLADTADVYADGRRLLAVWLVGLVLLAACDGSAEVEQPSRSDRVSAAVEQALSTDSRFDAVRVVLVVADGEPLVEQYSGTSPNEYHPVMSVTKSVLSTLVGVAIDDGLLVLDDTLHELLPAYADRMKPRVASVTLRDLLTMRGGFIEEDDRGGVDFAMAPDAVAAALATGQGASDTFGYSSAGVHLIAAALAVATGGSVLDYARTVLFDPLGVDTEPAAEPVAVPANLPQYLNADFAWPVDHQGIHQGWSFLKLRPSDMLAFGQLILDGGEWHGDQLISEAWVEEATSTQAEVDDPRSYGYLWWLDTLAGRDAVAALGHGGQLVVVVPDLDLVAVTVTELGDEDLATRISPFNMLTVVESAIAAGYGRR